MQERVFTCTDVSSSGRALDALLDQSSEPITNEMVAAALFWIFETKTNVDPGSARLCFRHDGGVMLSLPDKTLHVELRLSPGERYGVSDVERMLEETAADHELLLITTNSLTDDARTEMESSPSMHFIRLRRALQFDEATPRLN